MQFQTEGPSADNGGGVSDYGALPSDPATAGRPVPDGAVTDLPAVPYDQGSALGDRAHPAGEPVPEIAVENNRSWASVEAPDGFAPLVVRTVPDGAVMEPLLGVDPAPVVERPAESIPASLTVMPPVPVRTEAEARLIPGGPNGLPPVLLAPVPSKAVGSFALVALVALVAALGVWLLARRRRSAVDG